MKMYEIIDLSNLYMSIKDIKLPLKTTYKFSRLMRRAEQEMNFYSEEFGKIIETYAKRNEDGNYCFSADGQSIEIIEGKQAECNMKINELRNLEVELNDIKFTIDELECLNLSISELSCLMSLIEG